MLKTRLIPVLYLKNGLIVRSERFVDFRELGNPLSQLERLNEWNADEVIYVDITRDGVYDIKRGDHKIKINDNLIEILRAIAERCFMPLTFGGRITRLEQVDTVMANGADKVIINTGVYRDQALLQNVAKKYGRQAMVVGIDVKFEDNKHSMYIDNGQTLVGDDPIEYARRVEALGAGEIFLNSIDRDGTARGYDTAIVQQIARAVAIPVIAAGGAGSFDDFTEVITTGQASAAAAGNIFNFTENAYQRGKKKMAAAGIPVRL